MFCSSCGVALAQQMKYCNRCGSQLTITRDAAEIETSEKRLREEMVELFWVTVFGLGIILGGMAVIRNALHLSDWILIAYMIFSSTAFTINFALSLWQIRRLARIVGEAKGTLPAGQLDTKELGPVQVQAALEPVPSITENTTRTLEPVPKEQLTR
jgi:hypothetical protein